MRLPESAPTGSRSTTRARDPARRLERAAEALQPLVQPGYVGELRILRVPVAELPESVCLHTLGCC